MIFQTWKSKTSIPFNYGKWSETFKRLHSEYEYVLWDDADNRRFIQRYYPWFLPIYDAYPHEIYRVDAVRYFFLYQFGGLYVDMHTECLKPVAPRFQSGEVWLGRMGGDPEFSHSIPNAIMASRPLQEFWLVAIHILLDSARRYGYPDAMTCQGPEATTGPIVLKRAYDAYMSSEPGAIRAMIDNVAAQLPDDLKPQPGPSRVTLLEPHVWYPVDWSNEIHMQLRRETLSSRSILGERAKRWLFPRSFLVTYTGLIPGALESRTNLGRSARR